MLRVLPVLSLDSLAQGAKFLAPCSAICSSSDMPPDSPTLLAAVLLLTVSLHAVLRGAGLYLRFAASLCGALALAVLAERWAAPGLAAAASLPALPLAGIALGLTGMARCIRPVPPLPASLLLIAALAAGLLALFGFNAVLVLLPPLAGGIAVAAVAGLSGAPVTALAGALLAASAPAFLARGIAASGLLLLAAALAGFAVQTLASKRRAEKAAAA
jgi:hypothetical protein